ncbi:hypothetical protein L6164_028467 [Bauhinia variegata]|uniref:Uncharacterized protein n=1 Tax=Bauhinia variegata TaxID=167791 RepID=A0ACB9L6K4_BAUVA|nr:hypothetical protein L6164_028467 [Bauhinia variegata]
MDWASIKYSLMLWLILVVVHMPEWNGCLEKERMALLQIKAFFVSNGASDYGLHKLDSWVDDRSANCCGWDLVKCNCLTGHVSNLSLGKLHSTSADGYLFLNSSLFLPFEDLRGLDLSLNLFFGFVEDKSQWRALDDIFCVLERSKEKV